MSKPTEEELETAIKMAAQMRDRDVDPGNVPLRGNQAVYQRRLSEDRFSDRFKLRGGTEEQIFRDSRWVRGESAFREGVEDEVYEEPLRASASPV